MQLMQLIFVVRSEEELGMSELGLREACINCHFCDELQLIIRNQFSKEMGYLFTYITHMHFCK
jgi:hypothetical protein